MVKGAKTIAQYKIYKWVDENFQPDSVRVEFMSESSATIIDATGSSLALFVDENGKVVECSYNIQEPVEEKHKLER